MTDNPAALFDDFAIDDPADKAIPLSAIEHILWLRRTVSRDAAMGALILARADVRREQETGRRDQERREHGARRFVDQHVTNEAFRAELMNLDGLDEATQARLKTLRQTDPMGYAAELGLARMAEAERRAAAALDAKQ